MLDSQAESPQGLARSCLWIARSPVADPLAFGLGQTHFEAGSSGSTLMFMNESTISGDQKRRRPFLAALTAIESVLLVAAATSGVVSRVHGADETSELRAPDADSVREAALKLDALTPIPGRSKKWDWWQARTAFVPGQKPLWVTTMSETGRDGVHNFHDIYQSLSHDGGKTWSKPEVIPTLKRARQEDGFDVVPAIFGRPITGSPDESSPPARRSTSRAVSARSS